MAFTVLYDEPQEADWFKALHENLQDADEVPITEAKDWPKVAKDCWAMIGLRERAEFISTLKRAEQYDLPPVSVQVLTRETFVAAYHIDPRDRGVEASEIVLYNIGMKKIRSDPYTGMAMLYHYPRPQDAPPDHGGPGKPPAAAPDRSADQPAPQTADQPAQETTPMSKPARQDRNAEVDFRGERRSNATHASTTDPDSRLFRKSRGTGAILCFMGHTLMENRNGLIVQTELTHADGHAERRAALDMIQRHSPGSTRRLTLGADKGYDSADFVAELRKAGVTPHVARKARHSAIDGRTTRHAGYALSQKRRKKIEEPFGWAKTVGGLAQAVHRGLERIRARFTLTIAACNLARLPKLLAA